MAQTRKMQLADPPIEVLIRGDHYWRIAKDASTIRLSSSLVLTGNRTGIIANEIMVNHISLGHLDNDVRRFWDLETIGITHYQQKPLTAEDSQVFQEFRNS
jgi:hypothetical protein